MTACLGQPHVDDRDQIIELLKEELGALLDDVSARDAEIASLRGMVTRANEIIGQQADEMKSLSDELERQRGREPACGGCAVVMMLDPDPELCESCHSEALGYGVDPTTTDLLAMRAQNEGTT